MNIMSLYPMWCKMKRHTICILLVIVAISGGVLAFPLSYVSNTNVLIGFCLLPFALFVHGEPRINIYYPTLALVSGILAFSYSVRICYFFALAFFIIFLIEWGIGKTAHLVFFLIVFMSPFFEQVAVIAGFPLRLQLSEWSGSILSLTGMNIQVEGNMMIVDENVFTVDEACMGLHLLSTSMLMGVFILAYRFRKMETDLSWIYLAAFFLHVFVLNLISNLFRIVLLVAFAVLPDDPMHDVIGICCLLLYVVVPLYYFSGAMLSRFGKPFSVGDAWKRPPISGKLLMGCLALVMVWLGVRVGDERLKLNQPYAKIMVEGMKTELIQDGVTKVYDEDILIYVKTIPEFFTAEHTPLICWKGSGYGFEGIRNIMIGDHELYIGNLVKPGSRLYTAWWYDNGKYATISQADWRFSMLKGEPDFCLVNVTAADEATLKRYLQSMSEKKLLSINP